MRSDSNDVSTRETGDLSGAMITLAKVVVKKNPIKVSFYVFGLIICLFFKGFTVSETNQRAYNDQLALMEDVFIARESAMEEYQLASQKYYNSRGFLGWSCNDACTKNKREMDTLKKIYDERVIEENLKMAEAKAHLGLFSTHGVDEAKGLFYVNFARGKAFATTQSKWDMIFVGISAMGRDENFMSYVLRVIVQVLMNFTLGVISAVIGFMWSVGSIIQTYNSPTHLRWLFWLLASLAASSFCITWLLGFYFAVAGSTYVVAKLVSSTARLEDDRRRRDPRFVR